MDKLDAMRTLVRVVERKSFAKAAQDLNLPRSRVSDMVRQLERHLGVQLLTRTTRQVNATAEGEEYARRCLKILADVDCASEAVTRTIPAGPLRIDVHGTFARHFLFSELSVFLSRHPGIEMHVGEGDRLVDLVGEGIDCVIRVGEPTSSSLVGRKLGILREGTFASPGYLSTHGTPKTIDDLQDHRMIAFVSTKTKTIIPLEFDTADGVKSLALPVSMTVNAADSMSCLAVHGLGLIQVPRYRLQSELQDGLVVEILQAIAPTPTPVYLLYAAERHVSARARAFIDWVTPILVKKLAEQ